MPERPIEIRYDKGLHLPELDLWLDPPLPREWAFVSHAHSDHFARHDRLLCSPATARLIEARYGDQAQQPQVLEYDTPLAINGYSLQLLPAGHVLGSAMLHVTRLSDGATLLYTGDFKLRHGLTAEPARLLPAHTVVLETTFGLPQYLFPPREKVAADLVAFVTETLEGGGIPVLLGYSLGKAQEILATIAPASVPIMMHSSMVKLTQVYEAMGQVFPAWRPFKAEEAAGHVLIFPPSAARSLAIRKLKVARTVMLSGWALTPGAKYRYQVDEVFPLSDHADYAELLQCVEQTGARLVYTVHGSTREFAQTVRNMGVDAWSLLQDDQLELTLAAASSSSGPVTLPAAEEAMVSEDPSIAPDAFLAWARTNDHIAAHPSRLKKQEIMGEYFRTLGDEDLPRATRWFTASLDDPALSESPIQVGWATVRQALLDISKIREQEYREISRSQNDAGRTAFLILRQAHDLGLVTPRADPVTLGGIAEHIKQLRAAKGPSEKARTLADFLRSVSPLEGSYLVRLLTGELRTGSREGLVEEALAVAFEESADSIRDAAMLCGDLGRAALLAKHHRLEEAQPTPFVPIKVMLASPELNAEDIWTRITSQEAAKSVWLEDKFDGIRAQLHGGKGRGEIYTRDLNRITHQFPEIAHALTLMPDEAILDAEIVAYAENKKLTFHDLQKRLGRKEQGDLFIPSDITVLGVIFDILWLNGTSLMQLPLEERRQHLENLKLPPLLRRITVVEAVSADEIEAAFLAARRNDNEGLIAKDRFSAYTPGRRGKAWLKLKKAFATLDVVVVKAEQGHGKRSHVLSDYTFSVRDEKSGELRIIGKAYSGLTDAEIETLTTHFTEHTLSQRGNVRTVTPNVVLEIAFDSIQPSSRHDSGLSLRFPRIKAIRQDKTPADIDTLAHARKLAGVEG